MKKIAPIIALLIITSVINAQNDYLTYYKLVNTAKFYANISKQDSALNKYEKAFSQVDFIHKDYLDKAIKCCKITKNKITKDKLESKREKQIEEISESYKLLIDSLGKEDQRVRSRKYMKAQAYYFKSTRDSSFSSKEKKLKKSKTLMDEWWKTDSLNIEILKQNIEKRGFPGEKLVGKGSYQMARIILLHYDNDTANHIMGEILKQALLNGMLLPKDYAWIVDRHLMNARKQQLYLSIPFGLSNLSNEEKEIINARRLEIGLESIVEANIIYRKNSIIVKSN